MYTQDSRCRHPWGESPTERRELGGDAQGLLVWAGLTHEAEIGGCLGNLPASESQLLLHGCACQGRQLATSVQVVPTPLKRVLDGSSPRLVHSDRMLSVSGSCWIGRVVPEPSFAGCPPIHDRACLGWPEAGNVHDPEVDVGIGVDAVRSESLRQSGTDAADGGVVDVLTL
jgi:hypothetical protein